MGERLLGHFGISYTCSLACSWFGPAPGHRVVRLEHPPSRLFRMRRPLGTLDGGSAAGDRYQDQVQIAQALEHPVNRSLVGQHPGKQGPISSQACEFEPRTPFRPSLIELTFDLDLIVCRHGKPPQLVSDATLAR